MPCEPEVDYGHCPEKWVHTNHYLTPLEARSENLLDIGFKDLPGSGTFHRKRWSHPLEAHTRQ